MRTVRAVLAVVTFAATVPHLWGFPQQSQTLRETHITQNIQREVRHELLLLPFYSIFDNLAFSVQGDRVTLKGQVVRPDLKSDAEAAVKHIEGVQNVDNQIEVLPLSEFDNQTRQAEFRAIYSFPSLQKYGEGALPPIHIIVKNGHVTLVGLVGSQADKDTAGLRAKTVPNVFSVTNDLTVERSK